MRPIVVVGRPSTRIAAAQVTGAGVTSRRWSTPLTPYLAVRDARVALDWYAAHLDAERLSEPIIMPDGRVGHAELQVRGARLFLADPHPELAVTAPDPAGVPVSLHLEVDDVDSLVERLRVAGAQVDREPDDSGAGRIAVVRDPFGHRWMLNQRPATG